MDEAISALIDIYIYRRHRARRRAHLRASELDRGEEVRRGCAEVHWRPPHARATKAAEVGGRQPADDEGGDERLPDERNERAGLDTRAQGGMERGVRPTAGTGEVGARQRNATTTDDRALRQRM